MLRRIARDIALRLPPLRRVVEQRDAALRELRSEMTQWQQVREQQDAALRELRELRNQMTQWQQVREQQIIGRLKELAAAVQTLANGKSRPPSHDPWAFQ